MKQKSLEPTIKNDSQELGSKKFESPGNTFGDKLNDLYRAVLAPAPSYINQYYNNSYQEKTKGKTTKEHVKWMRFQQAYLSKVSENPEENYLLQLVARGMIQILNTSREPLCEGFKIHSKRQPFLVDNCRYATYTLEENPRLIIVPESESQKIRELINQQQDILESDEYKSIIETRRQIEIDYGDWSEAYNWPDKMYDVYTTAHEIESVLKGIELDIHHHFFTPNKSSSLGFSSVPIPDRVFNGLESANQNGDPLLKNFFALHYLLEISNGLEADFGDVVRSLSLRERYYLFDYIARKTKSEMAVVHNMIDKNGLHGFKVFLALEHGDERLGDQIVAFGQHEEVARTVFRYYSELLDMADRAEELVRTTADCEGEECQTLTKQVRENILKRAKKT